MTDSIELRKKIIEYIKGPFQKKRKMMRNLYLFSQNAGIIEKYIDFDEFIDNDEMKEKATASFETTLLRDADDDKLDEISRLIDMTHR